MTGKRYPVYFLFCILQFFFLLDPTILNGQDDHHTTIDSLTQLLASTKSVEVKKEVLISLCIQFVHDGEWEKHDQVITEMLLLQDEEVDSAYLAETYNRLGISNSLIGNAEESLKSFQKALNINEARGDMFGVSASYENLAEVYRGMGEYESAVDCLFKSIDIKKENNYSRLFNLYIKLANFQRILDTEKVDYYIGLARQELQKMDSIMPADEVVYYNELGTIFRDKEMYDSSIVCCRNVLRLSKQINWKSGIAAGLGSLAEVFYEMGNLDSAIVYHRQSLMLSNEISDCEGISEEYLSLAKMYRELNRNDSVLVLANKSLLRAEECDLLKMQSEVLRFIADYYSTIKDVEKAYSYLQAYYTMEDSISSADVKNNIAEMEAKYEAKEKQQEIELLTAENEIKSQRLRVSILTASILTLLTLIILYAFLMRRRQAKFKENDLKMQLFRSQMNPHFIFNALGSIQSYLYKNQADIAAGYLARFSFLTRSILENSIKESISLEVEIETLTSYIELEKMRLNDSFNYEIIFNKDLETEFINIPPMLIQPFIENAIKHGLKEIKEKGKLTISIMDKTDMLEVHITDNGIGINESLKASKPGHQSMALSIFTQRMQIIRKYSRKVPLPKIEDLSVTAKQGTRVELYIPILN